MYKTRTYDLQLKCAVIYFCETAIPARVCDNFDTAA